MYSRFLSVSIDQIHSREKMKEKVLRKVCISFVTPHSFINFCPLHPHCNWKPPVTVLLNYLPLYISPAFHKLYMPRFSPSTPAIYPHPWYHLSFIVQFTPLSLLFWSSVLPNISPGPSVHSFLSNFELKGLQSLLFSITFHHHPIIPILSSKMQGKCSASALSLSYFTSLYTSSSVRFSLKLHSFSSKLQGNLINTSGMKKVSCTHCRLVGISKGKPVIETMPKWTMKNHAFFGSIRPSQIVQPLAA